MCKKRKYLLALFILCLLLLALCACVKPPKSYTVQLEGRTFTVDTEQLTITCGIDTYKYDLSKYGFPYKLRIYYPNGATYWWEQDKNSGWGGWSDDYIEGAYVDGNVLACVLEYGFQEDKSERIMPCFLLLLLACVHILAPIGMWSCYFGMFREGEPSDTELCGIRILGILIILGTAAWFWDCF